MGKQSTQGITQSRPTWETLEEWVREHVQAFIQRLLEDELTECVGREKSPRRAAWMVASILGGNSLPDWVGQKTIDKDNWGQVLQSYMP